MRMQVIEINALIEKSHRGHQMGVTHQLDPHKKVMPYRMCESTRLIHLACCGDAAVGNPFNCGALGTFAPNVAAGSTVFHTLCDAFPTRVHSNWTPDANTMMMTDYV